MPPQPLPLPLGEVAERKRGRRGYIILFLPSQSKIKDFCQLPRRGSQVGVHENKNANSSDKNARKKTENQ